LTASQKIFLVKLRWFIFGQITSVFDFLLYLVNSPVSGTEIFKRNNRKVIVYLGEHLPPRIPRIAKWVKRSSRFSTVLVCSQQGFVEKFSNDEFDGVFLFRNAFHLKRIIKQVPGIHLIHGFAPKSYYPDLVRRSFNYKFICDYQDVYSIYYGLNPSLGWLKKELPHEKSCLEHADGIVGQSLEPNVAFRKYNIREKPKTIFFPLYCDDDVFQNNAKKLDPDNIHVVYAGGVAGSHRDSKQYGNIQFHSIINTLSKQKIHFHIYPSPSNIRADYEEYEEISKKNSFFHFHEPVGQDKLAKELSKYHFGLLCFFKGLSEQSDDKLKYATTLKLFNYIEAGIPILVSEDLGYQSWMVNRNRVGIGIADAKQFSFLKEKLMALDYDKLLEDLIERRKNLSLQKNISRLLEFYRRITSAN
jgi:hypothetical protein